MIAAAMSGGVDSAAAAVLLHESGERLVGLTLVLDEAVPSAGGMESARVLCRRLGVQHRVVDARGAFCSVKDYFCREYLAGRTPNPCVECNRRIKFGLLLEQAMALGADAMATGHYARSGVLDGRYYVGKGAEKWSQEYFLAMVGQDALSRSVFPLAGVTRAEAARIAAGAGVALERAVSSRDVCFVGQAGYADFVQSRTGAAARPGPILDVKGRVLGAHRGVIHYTVGQRRRLGIARGRPMYVLSMDAERNSVTVGDEGDWGSPGFVAPELNFMKLDRIGTALAVRVKVRYAQEAGAALLHPFGGGGARVEFEGMYAPGQLAVFYDEAGDVLCAGVIERPEQPGVALIRPGTGGGGAAARDAGEGRRPGAEPVVSGAGKGRG
jgi:tRNA-specific 2-thiouridylase